MIFKLITYDDNATIPQEKVEELWADDREHALSMFERIGKTGKLYDGDEEIVSVAVFGGRRR